MPRPTPPRAEDLWLTVGAEDGFACMCGLALLCMCVIGWLLQSLNLGNWAGIDYDFLIAVPSGIAVAVGLFWLMDVHNQPIEVRNKQAYAAWQARILNPTPEEKAEWEAEDNRERAARLAALEKSAQEAAARRAREAEAAITPEMRAQQEAARRKLEQEYFERMRAAQAESQAFEEIAEDFAEFLRQKHGARS